MIDQNVMWETRGDGIYEHDGRGQVFAHNLIDRSTGAGSRIRGKVTNRKVHGEPIVGGGHKFVNNILVGNGRPVETRGPESFLEGNLSEGVEAEVDCDAAKLDWSVTTSFNPGRRPEVLSHDFFGRPREGGGAPPGPFIRLPAGRERIDLRPGRR